MDSDTIASLERVGAVEQTGGLWKVTKAGQNMLDLLVTIAARSRCPSDKDDGIKFDYSEWQKADAAFDHVAYDAKCKAVDDEAWGGEEKNASLDKWLAAHERIMKGVERPPFKPHASYNKPGDGLQVYLCDADHYVQWLCPSVEVMRAFSDERIVGFNVWGLSHVVARDGGELRALPDEDERFLTAWAFRPPDMDDGPTVPSKPIV